MAVVAGVIGPQQGERLRHLTYGVLRRSSADFVAMRGETAIVPASAKEVEARDGIVGVAEAWIPAHRVAEC